jgi:Mn-dependent DtxR family transcriptional regulator
MTGMELEALSYFRENKSNLHYHYLAEYLKVSDHYVFVIYKGLERGGYLDFDTFRGIGTLTEKGKEFVLRKFSAKEKLLKDYSLDKKKKEKKKYTKKIEKIGY